MFLSYKHWTSNNSIKCYRLSELLINRLVCLHCDDFQAESASYSRQLSTMVGLGNCCCRSKPVLTNALSRCLPSAQNQNKNNKYNYRTFQRFACRRSTSKSWTGRSLADTQPSTSQPILCVCVCVCVPTHVVYDCNSLLIQIFYIVALLDKSISSYYSHQFITTDITSCTTVAKSQSRLRRTSSPPDGTSAKRSCQCSLK